MKRTCKSEWFVMCRPLAEPNVVYTDKEYHIERKEVEGVTVWYGLHTNWKSTLNGEWSVLTEGEFVECAVPLYEKLYKELNNTK